MTVAAGLGVAAVASLALNGSYLVQCSALARAPRVSAAAPLRSLRGLLRSRVWVTGATLGYGGFVLNTLALALAPLSLVETLVAAGLVVVAAGTRRATGRSLVPREAAGTLLMVAALALLAVGLHSGGPGGPPGTLVLIAFLAGAATLAAATVRRAGVAPTWRLGLAAGVLYGATNVALSALAASLRAGAVLSPLAVAAALGAVTTAVAGFFAFQRALQSGPPVAAVTLMTAGTSAVAILGGLSIMGEPLGTSPGLAAVHLLAFALVPVAAVLVAGVSRSSQPADGWRRTTRPSGQPGWRSPVPDRAA